MSTAPPASVVAWAGAEAITEDRVLAREAQLRRSPFGARLPAPDTAEGRNMRRWIVQLLAAEALVAAECRRRQLEPQAGVPGGVRLSVALGIGGVAAAVLAHTPGAAELADALAADHVISDEAVADYRRRNSDLFAGRQGGSAEAIRAELGAAARERLFARWLEAAHREQLQLCPGWEHPAEPGHPDATHRH